MDRILREHKMNDLSRYQEYNGTFYHKDTSKMKEFFDVQDIIDAGCTLEPLKCRACGSLEVEYNQKLQDAYCAVCGQWQKHLEL